MKPSLALAVGTIAASLATAGDLLLLYVVNSARPGFGALPSPPAGALVLGSYLGVLFIPLYALGYWGVSRALAPAGERAASAVFALGAYSAALGAVVHGVTALAIAADRSAGRLGGDPLEAAARHGAYLGPLWLLLGLAALAGSVIYFRALRGGRSALPRRAAWANPAALTLLFAAAAAPSGALGAFVAPAAPNLAHIFFFGIALLCLEPQALSKQRGAP